MHYVLDVEELIDEEGEEYGFFWLDTVDDEDLEWPWLQGERFDVGPESSVRFAVDLEDDEAGGFADYIAGPIPLITRALRDVFDACGVSNVDYYPVVVEGADSFDAFPEYFAINVVGLISAAGSGTVSSSTFGASGADVIDRFVLSEAAARSLPLFRLAEHLSTLIVSEKIKVACEAAQIDSLKFIPTNEWST